MATLWTYFRLHPWQRRALTVLLMVTLGGAAALILREHLRRSGLLQDLQNARGEELSQAAEKAYDEGLQSASFRAELAKILEDSHQETFRATLMVLIALSEPRPDSIDLIDDALRQMPPNRLVEALEILARPRAERKKLLPLIAGHLPRLPDGRLYPLAAKLDDQALLSQANFPAELIDRYRRIRFEAANIQAPPEMLASMRELILHPLILQPRRNRQVARILNLAATDQVPSVRAKAAVLAGRLGDRDVLLDLLSDKEQEVAAAAALSVGAEEMASLAPRLDELLRTSDQPRIAWACAWSLAQLDAHRWALRIAGRLSRSDPEIRDWLLMALPELSAEQVGQSVAALLTGEDLPAATVLSAAWRLGLAEAGPAAEKVLSAALSGESVTMSQLLAALEAASVVDQPLGRKLLALIRGLWGPETDFAMYRATQALAHQAQLGQADQGQAVSVEECVALLLRAVGYARRAQEQSGQEFVRTPVASAGAAAAAWRLQPTARWYKLTPGQELPFEILHESTAYGILLGLRLEESLAREILSWKLAASGQAQALELAMNLLPPRANRQGPAGDDPRQLACAAMMAAMYARRWAPQQSQAVASRITDRMQTRFGPVSDLSLHRSFVAALCALGRDDHAQTVLSSTQDRVIPLRRGLTALLMARDPRGLDWFLLEQAIDDSRIENLLLDQEFNEVLAFALPSLPRPWAALPEPMRRAQVQLLRQVYLVRRDSLHWWEP